MNYNNLCPHCMREIQKNGKGTCPYCGFDDTYAPELTHQLRPFTVLNGKYLVGSVLGECGFGITYIGYDLNLELRTAIKEFYPNGFCRRESSITNTLSPYGGSQGESFEKWRSRFIKEAKSLAKCTNLSGIVGVKDFFEENNTAYIVMEYLEGQTLKEYLNRQGGKLPVGWALQALEPVMVSMSQVHRAGIIHRDISPDNIMITTDGMMKLLDFGAAVDLMKEEERSLSIMLKPGYAPEEQYRTKGKLGPWSDVYALAATIYKCITGITPPEAMERMREDQLAAPGSLGINMPPSVEAALLKGMSVYADNRYQTMDEFHHALMARAEKGKPVTPCREKTELHRESNAEPVREEEGRQKRIGFAKIAGCAAVLFMGFLMFLHLSGDNGKQRDEAVPRAHEEGDDREAAPVEKEEETVSSETADSLETEPGIEEQETEEQEIVTYRYEFLVGDVTWYEAYEDCIARGGHLVTIESQEEFEILTEQLMDQKMERYLFWLGGMRLSESREYRWVDEAGNMGEEPLCGSDAAVEYQNCWLEGEPTYQSGESQERFMMMFYKTDQERWVWNDVAEDLLSEAPFYEGRIAYICEYGM